MTCSGLGTRVYGIMKHHEMALDLVTMGHFVPVDFVQPGRIVVQPLDILTAAVFKMHSYFVGETNVRELLLPVRN